MQLSFAGKVLALVLGFATVLFCHPAHAEIEVRLEAYLRANPSLLQELTRLSQSLQKDGKRPEVFIAGPSVIEFALDRRKDSAPPLFRIAYSDDVYDETLLSHFHQSKIISQLPDNYRPLSSVAFIAKSDGSFQLTPDPFLTKLTQPDALAPVPYEKLFPWTKDVNRYNNNYWDDEERNILEELLLAKSLQPKLQLDPKLIDQHEQAVRKYYSDLGMGEFIESTPKDHVIQQLAENLRSVSHPALLFEVLKEYRLLKLSDGTRIPPPIKSAKRLPSEMRVDGTKPGQLKSNESGQLVQRNDLPNPFLPFIGKRLADLPQKLREMYFPHGFSWFHRTKSKHWKDSVLAGESFVSLGYDSALEGAASWGPGLYLSRSPALLHYGPDLVQFDIDPNAVIGKDIDLFVGKLDGLIAVLKKSDMASAHDTPTRAIVQEAFRNAVEEKNDSQALDLLRYLTISDLKGINEEKETVSGVTSLGIFLKGMDHSLVHDWLDRIEKRPELLTPSERESLAGLLLLEEATPDTNRKIQALLSQVRNPLVVDHDPLLNEFSKAISSGSKLVELNAPQTLLSNTLNHTTRLLSEWKQKVIAGLESEESPRLSHLMVALDQALETLVTVRNESQRNGAWILPGAELETKITETADEILKEVKQKIKRRLQSDPQVAFNELLQDSAIRSSLPPTTSFGSAMVHKAFLSMEQEAKRELYLKKMAMLKVTDTEALSDLVALRNEIDSLTKTENPSEPLDSVHDASLASLVHRIQAARNLLAVASTPTRDKKSKLSEFLTQLPLESRASIARLLLTRLSRTPKITELEAEVAAERAEIRAFAAFCRKASGHLTHP